MYDGWVMCIGKSYLVSFSCRFHCYKKKKEVIDALVLKVKQDKKVPSVSHTHLCKDRICSSAPQCLHFKNMSEGRLGGSVG